MKVGQNGEERGMMMMGESAAARSPQSRPLVRPFVLSLRVKQLSREGRAEGKECNQKSSGAAREGASSHEAMMINPGSVMPLSVRACGMLRPHSPVWAERIANYVRVPRLLHAPPLITTAKWDTFIFDLPRSQIRLLNRSRGPRAFKKLDRWAEAIAKDPHIQQPIPVLQQKTEPITTVAVEWRGHYLAEGSEDADNERRINLRQRSAQQRVVRQSAHARQQRSGVGAVWRNKANRSPLFLPPLPITLFAPVYKQGAASCWRI